MLIPGNKSFFFGCGEESFHKYTDIFSKYFNYGTSHDRMLMSGKNSIMVHSRMLELNCRNCVNSPRLCLIEPLERKLGGAFFDFSKPPQCGRFDVIKYGNSCIGYYCSKNNVLFTSDITHYEGNEEAIRYIFSRMGEEGFLHPLKEKERPSITLGADPELEVIMEGKFISARRLPSFLGYSNITKISRDGTRGDQRELRPSPSSDPEELVENIKELIKTCAIFGEELTVRGNNTPIGGHIHIGGISYSPEIILLLDHFLSVFNKFTGKARIDSGYGKMGDYRIQPHGFEYRTPPPVWLTTPKLAKMTLSLVKRMIDLHVGGKDININIPFIKDSYIQDIINLGFDENWTNDFIKEINFAAENLDVPLSILWDVVIPEKYQIRPKDYIQNIENGDIPRTGSEDIPRPERVYPRMSFSTHPLDEAEEER